MVRWVRGYQTEKMFDTDETITDSKMSDACIMIMSFDLSLLITNGHAHNNYILSNPM